GHRAARGWHRARRGGFRSAAALTPGAQESHHAQLEQHLARNRLCVDAVRVRRDLLLQLAHLVLSRLWGWRRTLQFSVALALLAVIAQIVTRSRGRDRICVQLAAAPGAGARAPPRRAVPRAPGTGRTSCRSRSGRR